MRVPLALLGGVAALAVLAAGVGVATPRVAEATGLRSFSDCGSLAAHMRPGLDAAEAEYRRRLPADRTHFNPGHLAPDRMFWVSSPDKRGTTTVFPGAEALDVAKLDGTRLISARVEGVAQDGTGGALTLRVTELGGPDPGERGRLRLPSVDAWGPSGLLVLPNHRVLMVGNEPGGERNAVVALVDATDPAHPILLRKETLTGSLSSVWSGEDGLVGMLVAGRPAGLVPASAVPVDPEFPLNHNWTLPRPAAPTALLPGRQIVDGGGTAVAAGPLLDCAHVWAPQRDAGIGIITVRTLDPGDGDAMLERGRAFAVLAERDVVHATADRFYVATSRPSRHGQATSTELHAFASSESDPATYLVSGSIPHYLPGREELSAHDHRLRVIASRPIPYRRGENDLLVLKERKRRLVVVAQRTGILQDAGVQGVSWFTDYAVVHAASYIGASQARAAQTLWQVDLRGRGVGSEERLPTRGDLAEDMTSVGGHRILVLGQDVARAEGSAASARGLQQYPQASVVEVRVEGRDRGLVEKLSSRGKVKPTSGGLLDKLNLPPDVSIADEAPTFLPGVGLAVLVGEARRSCSGEAECYDGFTMNPTVLALRVWADGVLELVGRVDDAGPVQRVLEYDGGMVLLTDKAVLLTDSSLRVRRRLVSP